MALDHWYDGQLRRYWLQFCRIFESFQYESGVGASGTRTLRSFPVSLGMKNRQVGHILRNGSENTMLSTPRITCEMVDIQPSAERRQAPNHVSSVHVYERAIDPVTNRYTGELGNTYSVERYMAIPYDMVMRANIWTSNEDQKLQFMEQVMALFNPSIDIQTGDNPIDWTSLTVVVLDSIGWSNRDLPIGTDDGIEVSTLTFKMPVWISPPAKIKRQNIIHQIITNIGEMNKTYKEDQGEGYNFSTKDLYTRTIVSPGNHQVRADILMDSNNRPYCEVTLLSSSGVETDDNGDLWDWRELLRRQGQYRKGVSQFRLKTTDDMDDHDSDIIGIFDFHPTAVNKILWTPDQETLPVNTLQTINGMVDPNAGHAPGRAGVPEAVEGQRYLLADDLHSVPEWSNLSASINDIIEYKNGSWQIAFDASIVTSNAVVLNGRSGKQLRWTGEIWIDAISADYNAGYWRIFL